MGIIGKTDDGALGGLNHGRDDAITYVAHWTVFSCSGRESGFDGAGDVVHSPVRECSGRGVGVGLQPQFVSTRIEPHVERLIEEGCRTKKPGPPPFRSFQIGCRVDDGSKSPSKRVHKCLSTGFTSNTTPLTFPESRDNSNCFTD